MLSKISSGLPPRKKKISFRLVPWIIHLKSKQSHALGHNENVHATHTEGPERVSPTGVISRTVITMMRGE